MEYEQSTGVVVAQKVAIGFAILGLVVLLIFLLLMLGYGTGFISNTKTIYWGLG